jgi:hypothetical protein
MSDGESEESDGFFGIDKSTKENENDVEVLVGKEIDDNDPFFADADDQYEGEENEDNKRNNGNAQDDNDRGKGEGAIEGSNKHDRLFHSSGSDCDDGKTIRRKEETRIRMYCLSNRTSPQQRKNDKGRELKTKQTMNREPRKRKKEEKERRRRSWDLIVCCECFG